MSVCGQLNWLFSGGVYKVFPAPVTVNLKRRDTEKVAVKPDIIIIKNNAPAGTGGEVFNGIPEMIIEVTETEKTGKLDMFDKFMLYGGYGVPDYWVIDMDGKSVHAHALAGGVYKTQIHRGEAPLKLIKGSLSVRDIFKNM
jgi:Uma2 family endonuclease